MCPTSSPGSGCRLSAFHPGARRRGATADPRLVGETNFTPAEACERALDLLTLPERPTALVCSGDLIAQGVLAAARQLVLRVPADLSVVSLSALPGPRVTTAGIAAVVADFEQAGATAASLLLDLAVGGPAPGAPVWLPTTFDPASSIAPPA